MQQRYAAILLVASLLFAGLTVFILCLLEPKHALHSPSTVSGSKYGLDAYGALAGLPIRRRSGGSVLPVLVRRSFDESPTYDDDDDDDDDDEGDEEVRCGGSACNHQTQQIAFSSAHIYDESAKEDSQKGDSKRRTTQIDQSNRQTVASNEDVSEVCNCGCCADHENESIEDVNEDDAEEEGDIDEVDDCDEDYNDDEDDDDEDDEECEDDDDDEEEEEEERALLKSSGFGAMEDDQSRPAYEVNIAVAQERGRRAALLVGFLIETVYPTTRVQLSQGSVPHGRPKRSDDNGKGNGKDSVIAVQHGS